MTSEKLSPEDLQELLTELIDQKHRLADQLDRLSEFSDPRSLGAGSSLPTHPADQGTETFDEDQRLGLAEHLSAEAIEIDEALGRLEDGSYGICESCGTEIIRERLLVIPSAARCNACQTKTEAA